MKAKLRNNMHPSDRQKYKVNKLNEINGAANKSGSSRTDADRCGAAGCAHGNAVYARVQSGSKINAVGSDSVIISSGLSRVGFII